MTILSLRQLSPSCACASNQVKELAWSRYMAKTVFVANRLQDFFYDEETGRPWIPPPCRAKSAENNQKNQAWYQGTGSLMVFGMKPLLISCLIYKQCNAVCCQLHVLASIVDRSSRTAKSIHSMLPQAEVILGRAGMASLRHHRAAQHSLLQFIYDRTSSPVETGA